MDNRITFPKTRLRRIRDMSNLRNMVSETQISVQDLIYPIFVTYGRNKSKTINSMPGIYQLSLDVLKTEIDEISKLKIPAVLIFGIPQRKTDRGSEAYNSNGIVQEAIRTIKQSSYDLLVIADTCLCEYTNHGHCGVVSEGRIKNDESLELLAKTAVSQAEAGADMIAPSAMMDGQVATIRKALDDKGYSHIPIMSYSAKYSSGFYGPFREAVGSSPQFGDRTSYQMDPANIQEAMREIEHDIIEGTDVIMVKPALAYLDVISKAKERFRHPLAGYSVSGEYSMIKAASQMGWLDERQVVMEVLTSIKRAGADILITYFAKNVAQWINESADT